MCVLLLDVFKHLLLKKTDVLKTCQKSKIFGKKIWRNALALKSKKVQGVFGKTFILTLIFSAVFRHKKSCLRFLLNSFFWKREGFYQSSLEKEVDFRDIWTFLLPKNWSFKKLRHGFVDERVLITTTVISSCHWKTLVPFR